MLRRVFIETELFHIIKCCEHLTNGFNLEDNTCVISYLDKLVKTLRAVFI